MLEPEENKQDNKSDKDSVEIAGSPTLEELKFNEASTLTLKKPTHKRTPTQEIISNNKLERTNSTHFDKENIARTITPGDRNHQHDKISDDTWKDGIMKDGLIIGVFSLEASANFSTTYHKKLKADKLFNSKDNMDKIKKEKLSSNVNYTSANNIKEAFAVLYKDKSPPHIIPIIEGGRDLFDRNQEVRIADNSGKEHLYILNKFHIEGKTAKNTLDKKQNMSFYVREDMQKALSINEATIIVANDKGEFKVAEISFETENAKKYSVLIPHVPNKFVKTQTDCDSVHQAFQSYANNRSKKDDGTIVIGYIGDTNYKKEMQPYSKPSGGGNNGKNYISLTSSGAAEHTHFMQAIDLNKDIKSYAMAQPNTLNLVELAHKKGEESTDHPSIQTTIVLDSEIKGRQYNATANLLKSDSSAALPVSENLTELGMFGNRAKVESKITPVAEPEPSCDEEIKTTLSS